MAPCPPYKRGCIDLSVEIMHLKDPLILFGSEGSALTPPLFLLQSRIILLCHCSTSMTKFHFLVKCYGTKLLVCASFLLQSRIILLCHCSTTMTKFHFLVKCYGTKLLVCAHVPLKPHSLIHSHPNTETKCF